MKKIAYLLILTLFLVSCGEKKEVTESVTINSNTGIVKNKITEEKVSTGNLVEDKEVKTYSKEEIFQKIEEQLKKKELESQSSVKPEIKNIFVQGDFKAEYISNDGDYTKSDKIKITQEGKTWEIPGVYDINNKTEQQKECFKENKIGSDNFKDTGDCWTEQFVGFKDYSINGYLSYASFLYEVGFLKIIDIKTGKDILKIEGNPSISGFIKEGKQFIYGMGDGMTGYIGLHITIKGDLSKTKKILEDPISGGYIDEKNIYLKTINDINGIRKTFYKIIDIETEKVIYSQEIK